MNTATAITMKTCIFISRHVPTEEQIAVAAEAGFRLVHVGDVDAFDTEAVLKLIRAYICSECPDCGRNSCDCGRIVRVFDHAAAVACVHPMVAWIAAAEGLDVLVFLGFLPASCIAGKKDCASCQSWQGYPPANS